MGALGAIWEASWELLAAFCRHVEFHCFFNGFHCFFIGFLWFLIGFIGFITRVLGFILAILGSHLVLDWFYSGFGRLYCSGPLWRGWWEQPRNAPDAPETLQSSKKLPNDCFSKLFIRVSQSGGWARALNFLCFSLFFHCFSKETTKYLISARVVPLT